MLPKQHRQLGHHWQIVQTVGKWLVGMPVMSQRRPNNFKTLLDQQKLILLGHFGVGVIASYTNDKFEKAQPVAIIGKWLVGSRLAKRPFPTVGQQLLRNLPVLPQLLSTTWEVKHTTKKERICCDNRPAEIMLFFSIRA